MTDDDTSSDDTPATSAAESPVRGETTAGDRVELWTESQVPDNTDTAECPYCGRPFTHERFRDLHRGREHPTALSEAEIEAYRTAVEAERDDLRRFRLLALGALVLMYFGFLMAFAAFA